ncbi:MAG: ATP-binding protein [Aeromonadales bacterium]|nr:ATP-binding protein [Aeromonadales bacterium]MDY2890856.1 ATP-binding protein [Succinivibrio sp.]
MDLDCDIYITGSNSRMLSSEYATALSGRCVEIKMLPMSFSEFLSFHGFEVQEENSLGIARKTAVGPDGLRHDLRELFDAYLRFGGMHGIVELGFDLTLAMDVLDGICSSVVLKNIVERENLRGQRQVSDPILLRKIVAFLACNIGSSVPASSIGSTLSDEGLLSSTKKIPGAHTTLSYLSALMDACLFYEIKRFDIKEKEFLRTLSKHYIADIGLRNCILGFRNRDTGHVLENIVFFELLRRGYDVAVGKIGDQIDFIATSAQERLYVQVTETMESEEVRRRELAPLQRIRDNYEKIILSPNPGLESSYEGIKSISLIDWLLEG